MFYKENLQIDNILMYRLILVLFILGLWGSVVQAQPFSVNSDQWTATDALGRKLHGFSEVGNKKADKLVGIFYWTWHQADGPGGVERTNLAELLAQYDDATVEEMMNDFYHPNWEGQTQFTWDEPLFGYYHTTDEWVLRKHSELLADAGVDVVFFDCTNGNFTWKDSYTKLLEVWSQARKDGVKTPQIAFLLPFGANENSMSDIVELYNDLYQPGLYKDLWFMWENKPLIMGYPESLVPVDGTTAGLRFTAADTFYAVNASCPSWANNIGNLTFKLFAWSNSYRESVDGIPLAQKTFINFNDNEKLKLTFEGLPAGDYVWELSDGTEKVGVWKWTDGDNEEISYYNGSVVSGSYESEIAYSPDYIFTRLTSGTSHVAVEISGISVTRQEIEMMKDFFTFRPGQPGYTQGPSRDDHWGWLEVYPQHGFPLNSKDGIEQVCVSIAQNASWQSNGQCTAFNGPNTYGRNYTANADGSSGSWDNNEDSYLYGANFQQQWSRAFELDPKLVWVTGWNEWIFGRFEHWSGCSDAPTIASSFPDQFDKYRSRDIEPVKSWGDKGDVYYMQLVDYVRLFKGVQQQNSPGPEKTIDMENSGSWANVTPEYCSYKGNTLHRNHQGNGSWNYSNTSGRNDIVAAKVARDNNFVYFLVTTDSALTDKSDPAWMRLFIDIDRNKSTGWEGYDFIINRNSPADSVLVERSTNDWIWETAGKAEYVIHDKSLVLKIPLKVLGVQVGDRLNFEFKWSDNMQEEDNIMDFYVNGDVAPGGRFNYVYCVDKTKDGYQYGENPQGTNQGIKCELYDGCFDSIPQFNQLKVTDIHYLSSVQIPEAVTNDFALKYTGFFEAPEKDEYIFSIDSNAVARVFIDEILVIDAENFIGKKTGMIRLMPGKHFFRIEYISGKEQPSNLYLQMQSSSFGKSLIPENLLSKYNVYPEVDLSFVWQQNYYSEFDTVVTVSGSDPDGHITNVELYNGKTRIAEANSFEYLLKNMDAGEYSVYARVKDNDGAVTESNHLNFEVRTAFNVPGIIQVEEYRKGINIIITESDDYDGGLNVKSTYGNADYPVEIQQSGYYKIVFRVPVSSRSAIISVKIDGEEVAKVDAGNMVSDDKWCDVEATVYLPEGEHLLGFDFQGRITLHKIDISLATGIENLSMKFFDVIPNPSSGDFIIHSEKPLESVAIYDITGKKLLQTFVKSHQQICRLCPEIMPGVYLLQAKAEDGAHYIKRIIKK